MTRETIAEATRAHEKLYRDFPVVLPRLVGDRDVWSARIRGQLDRLKPLLHRGESAPALEALLEREGLRRGLRGSLLALARTAPALRPLLEALVWTTWGEGGPTVEQCELLEAWAPRLTALLAEPQPTHPSAISSALRLLDLVRLDGAMRVAPMATLLTDVRLATLSWEPAPACDVLEAAKDPRVILGLLEAKREAPLGPRIVEHLEALVHRDEGPRRIALNLLRFGDPTDLIEARESWWRKFGALKTEARLLAALGKPQRRADRERLLHLMKNARSIASERPETYPAREWLDAACDATFAKDRVTAGYVIRALEQLPDRLGQDRFPRLQLLLWWARWPPASLGKLRHLAREWLPFLDRERDWDRKLLPWQGIVEATSHQCPRPDDEHPILEPGALTLFLEALHDSRRCEDAYAGLSTNEQESARVLLATLASACSSPAEAAARFLAILSRPGRPFAERWSSLADTCRLPGGARERKRMVRLIEAAAGKDPESFANAYTRLHEMVEDVGDLRRLLRLPLLEEPAIVRYLLRDSGARRLLRLARWLEKLRGSGDSLPLRRPSRKTSSPPSASFQGEQEGIHRPAAWVSQYPPRLGAALRQLAGVDPKARWAALRSLGPSGRSRSALQREIDALTVKIAEATPQRAQNMRRRLEALRERLQRPPRDISDRVLEKAVRRIEGRFARIVVSHWEARIERAFERKMLGSRHLRLPEDWLPGGERRPVLWELLALPASSKELAARLLGQRSGPPPWDLRDSPANRAFLERMREAGICPEPWIDGLEPRVVADATGAALSLELEKDPLEVFLMGQQPCQTCLAPGSFNFFSAISNAADINKRVLHARDGDGEVVGRCLLAVTDRFELLTFHAYESSRRVGFERLAADFARALAERMGTTCVPRGRVSTLESDDWYDDGPRDLTGQLAFLEDGSEFRAQLSKTPPLELERRLREAGSPLGFEWLLSQVMSLPEVQESLDQLEAAALLLSRQRLIVQFLFGLCSASQKLREAGRSRASLEIISRVGAAAVRFGWSASLESAEIACELIEAGAPTSALRVLRATRHRSVRTWEEEQGLRRVLAARAHELLHRPTMAKRLRRRE